MNLDGACVRIVGVLDAPGRGRLAPLVRGMLPQAYDVRLSLEAREASRVRDPRFAKRMSEIEALERFLESRDDWSDERDELLRLGRELIAAELERA
jgi:hypothetical protein